ncbi:MAG: hypothetical protein ACLPV8_00730 [Steroidobacteraceae bacterium]
MAGRPAAVSSDRAHGDDNDSSNNNNTQSDGQRRLSHVQFALLNKGDPVNRDRLILTVNRTGANGLDGENVHSAILRENVHVIARLQKLTRSDALLQRGRVSGHGLQRRTSDKADD